MNRYKLALNFDRFDRILLAYICASLFLTSLYSFSVELICWYFVFFTPFFCIKKSKKKPILINSTVVGAIWISVSLFRSLFFILNGLQYPFNPTLLISNVFFISWFASGLIIQKGSKYTLLIIGVEFVFAFLTFERTYIAILLVLIGFTIQTDQIKLILKRGLAPILLSFILVVYLRTAMTTSDLNFSVQELAQVISKSVERVTIPFQTDIFALDSKQKNQTFSDVAIGLVPRFLNANKPNLSPGLEVNSLYWNDIVSKKNHMPIGFVGSHIRLLGKYFWIGLILQSMFITGLLYILNKKYGHLGWISSFFVFINFIIPEHFVFYLSAWIRVLASFLIILLLINWKTKAVPHIALVYSKSMSYGGIQRIVELIKLRLIEQNISFNELIFEPSQLFAKFSFSIQFIPYLFKKTIFINSHIHFYKLLKFKSDASKVVTLLHGIELNDPDFSIELNTNDCFLSNSDRTKKLLKTNNHVDIVRYPFLWIGLNENKSKSSSQNILCVSRLTKEDSYKQIDRLITSWSEIAKVFPKAKLQLIGMGNHKNELEKLARSLKLTTSIEFYGFVSDDDLKTMYQNGYAFILPSTSEGQGLVYFEAMSAGLPVIGLKEGVLTEFIQHEKEGLLIENSTNAITQSLIKVLSDKNLHQKMSQHAFDYAHSVYTNDDFFTLIDKELNNVRDIR